MKNMSSLKQLCAAAIILACNSAAQATIIDQGNTLRDTETNYTWYDLTSTTSISYSQMLSNFSNANSQYFGYKYATRTEIQTFIAHAGSPQTAFNLLGQTGTNCCARADGFYNDGNASNALVGQAYIMPNPPSFFFSSNLVDFIADFRNINDVDWSGTGNKVGSFIYKAQAVPEPSSVFLFALGALGLIYARRRA